MANKNNRGGVLDMFSGPAAGAVSVKESKQAAGDDGAVPAGEDENSMKEAKHSAESKASSSKAGSE